MTSRFHGGALLALLALLALPRPAVAQARRPAARPPTPAPAVPGPALSPVVLKALAARSIGPAIMGGRVSDFALDPQDPFTFYVAFATSGLWKTTDNGGSFTPLTDKAGVWSTGAVAVTPSAPKVVWLGSGEANDRNSSGWGTGVYRSTDGGSTWQQAGLRSSRTIARIAPHPTDSNTAYVAAMGDLWSPGGERGLFKTTDGGQTWQLVLAAPVPHRGDVGAGDVILDPSDASVVYTVLYARRRTPWSFAAGAALTNADVGGIFKSSDGGATWTKLEGGLPGRTQRIGLAISPKSPKVVYAVVQSDEGGESNIDDNYSRAGGVFRSEDGGASWTRVSRLNPRPFYFSQIRVDPTNENRVYLLGYALHVSEDGGRTFREDHFKNVHPDNHAMAIDPRNPARVLLGTDGGVYQSFTRGSSWAQLNRVAAGQFYRINVDQSTPYRICGGLQDNLNWVGPSQTRSQDGILNTDWINIGGGDGFSCVFDAENPDLVFTESQSGYAHSFNLRTGEARGFRPDPAEGQQAFRFHWNSPLVASPHRKGVLYLAGNRVFEISESGRRWRPISPDLSAQDLGRIMTVGSGAETHGVVYTLAESPVRAGLLWAATDDGKLWVSENGGGDWTDLTAGLPGPAKGQWIYRIEPSRQAPGVAYLAVSAFRTGNYAPLVYRTADRGASWQSIAGDLPVDVPAKVVREDLKNPNLLYAGTEGGLYLSADRGGHWVRFGELPPVPVDDILVHPRDNDLVIATHGRSLYVVDDLRPVQELTAELQAKPAHFFEPRPAHGMYRLPGWHDWEGSAVFRGANPPEGAIFTYYVKEYTGDQVSIAIADSAGTPIANLQGSATPGFNRVTWNLRPTQDLLIAYGGEGQKFVRPGPYTVTLTMGTFSMKHSVRVTIAEGIETR